MPELQQRRPATMLGTWTRIGRRRTMLVRAFVLRVTHPTLARPVQWFPAPNVSPRRLRCPKMLVDLRDARCGARSVQFSGKSVEPILNGSHSSATAKPSSMGPLAGNWRFGRFNHQSSKEKPGGGRALETLPSQLRQAVEEQPVPPVCASLAVPSERCGPLYGSGVKTGAHGAVRECRERHINGLIIFDYESDDDPGAVANSGPRRTLCGGVPSVPLPSLRASSVTNADGAGTCGNSTAVYTVRPDSSERIAVAPGDLPHFFDRFRELEVTCHVTVESGSSLLLARLPSGAYVKSWHATSIADKFVNVRRAAKWRVRMSRAGISFPPAVNTRRSQVPAPAWTKPWAVVTRGVLVGFFFF